MTPKKLVVLGTGGTIAGRATHSTDNVGYTAGAVDVVDLLAALPALSSRLGDASLVSEQIAQIDSKDMDATVWQHLLRACLRCLADPAVAAVLITHGTDTLEETAYFLHLALAGQGAHKPVVLTCAMRPASALSPDGPQNLLDAVTVALDPRSHGVLAVCAGAVHAAQHVQKQHTYRVDAFDSGDAGPLAWVEEGRVRWCHVPALATPLPGLALAPLLDSTPWPRVELVLHYADAGGWLVQALCAADAQTQRALRGLVVAGTGNGTVNTAMQSALEAAQRQGVRVALASRCARGGVVRADVGAEGGVDSAGFRVYPGVSAVKARIRLMLELMA